MLPQGRTRTGTPPAQPEFFSQHCQTHFQDVAVGPHQFVVSFMSPFPQTSGAGCHPSVALRAVALEPGSLGTDFCPWFEAHGAGLCKRRAHSPRLFLGPSQGISELFLSWQWDWLYQHNLDCVILAWDCFPFPTPGCVCCPRELLRLGSVN